MPTLHITLFGPPRAEREGVPVKFRRHQTLALLAYLASTDRPHGRAALAALFWPELDEQESHAALRRILYDLGRTIGKGWRDLGDGHVVLPSQPGLWVDVRRFHTLVAQVTAHGHAAHALCDSHGASPCDNCLAALTESAGLYRDDFLAGFSLRGAVEFDAWQTFTTESLRLELATVLEKLSASHAGRSQYDLAMRYALRWLALDLLNESSHRLLMQLHASSGDRAAAARQYEQCARVLAAELGIEPAPETTALYHELVPAKLAAEGASVGDRPGMAPAVAQQVASPARVSEMQSSPAPHNLPPDVTPFIGRRAALGQVAERLADPACRLLTVLGPGGIGKTRLAIQAARGETERFPHGIYFVDLAPVPSAELLSAAILRTLQVPQHAAAEADQHLLDFVKDKRMLLVLDNYEHLLTGPEPERRDGYGLITKMAAAAPQLKLLVTSRSRLNVPAECLEPLEGPETPPSAPRAKLASSPFEGEGDPGLAPLPGGERSGEGRPSVLATTEHVEPAAAERRRWPARGTAAALGRYSATALFLECVRRLQPGFRPAADEAQAIAHICRLLEGVPLAIELAAAWTRVLPLDEITRRLEHGLDLLTTTMRGVPPRQRSMVATFDHSWRLLTPRERSILRQLSVFRGGFTLEAAAAVARASLTELANLVDASWLALAASGRYAIHELVRQYCADKLEREHPVSAEAGETGDEVRRRHAVYFQSLLASRWEQLFRRIGAIADTTSDLGNLMVAWEWSLMHDDLTTVWGLGDGLGLLADRQGSNPEIAHVLGIGIERLRAAQAAERGGQGRVRERAAVLAMVLTNQSERFSRLGRLDGTEACLKEAAAWLNEADSGDARWAEASWFYRRMVAWTKHERGDFGGSEKLFRDLLSELRAGQISVWPHSADATLLWQPEPHWGQGFNALALGDFAEARRLAEEGIALAEQLGSGLGRGFASHLLAWALINTGEYRRAEQEARRLLSTASTFGDTIMTAVALVVLGRAQFALCQYDRARTWWRRGLALARRIGLQGNVTTCLIGLGDIELALGNTIAARQLYDASLAPTGRPPAAASPDVLAALIDLGRVALFEGRPAEARECLRQVLSRPGRWAATTAEAIAYTAEALLRQGELARPAELCGFILSWHGTPFHIRAAAEKLLGEIEARLPPENLATALARGRVRRVDEVVAQIVGL